MRARVLRAAALAGVAAAVVANTAAAITPVSGGEAGGTAIVIDDGPGDQSEPRVGGDLVVYTHRGTIFASGSIHYLDLGTGADSVVPGGAPGDSDILSDVDGSRIVFSRTRAADNATAIMLLDTTTGAVTELDPQGAGTMRFGAAIGGATVAYAEFAFDTGIVFAYDLASGTATDLSQSPELAMNPAVSPAGDVVVWERCTGSNCDVLQAVRSGGVWSAPTVLAATSSNESNPDTDGTTVVYDSERPSATGQDIYFRPVAGGPEVALELPGQQRNPSISNGVISFESKTSLENPADVFIYVIATNAVFRVTNTPTVDETLNDVAVSSAGVARLVWAANDDFEPGLHNVYARSFTVPLWLDGDPPTIACGAADGAWHDANVSIACTAADAASGLANPGDASFSLSTSVPTGAEDADAATGTRQVCDRAGNCATAGPVGGNKVDRRAPLIALPVERVFPATSPAGATVGYSVSASDGSDPSPVLSCSPAPGSVFAIGATTVTCTATDHVGNTAGDEFVLTVLGAKDQLEQLAREVVAASGLPPAVQAQLLARIAPFAAAFDPNDPRQRRTACAALASFARLLSARIIPPTLAARWVVDANRIRAVIGC